MRLRKWISCFIILIVTLLVFKQNVLGVDISGGINLGSNSYGNGGGGDCKDDDKKYDGIDGIRVTILNSNGILLNDYSKDFYKNVYWQSKTIGKAYGDNCSKIEYLKGTCSARTNNIVKFEKTNRFPIFLDGNGNLRGIANYLENNDYSGLRELIKSTGYPCLDPTSNSPECSIDSIIDTYVVVEPMAKFGGDFATAYEMPEIGAECYLANKWALLSNFRASEGDYFGHHLSDGVSAGNAGIRFYNSIKNLNSTNGLAIYSLSDVLNITPPTYSCKMVDGKYYDKKGKEVNEEEYNNSCNIPVSDKTCKSEFQKLIDSGQETNMVEREKLLHYYPKALNLLNLSITSANVACGAPTSCNYPANSDDQDCLSAKFTPSNFDENNLSCYTNQINMPDGKIGYCFTAFNLYPTISTLNNSVKSGQLYFNVASGEIMKGTFNQTCYFIEDIQSDKIDNQNLSNYLSNAVLDDKILTLQDHTIVLSRSEDNKNKYETKEPINILYTIPKVYEEKVSGKDISEFCNKCKFDEEKNSEPCDKCLFAGYGIFSNFNASGSKDLPFKLTFDIGDKGQKTYESLCPVSSTPQLINEKNELNLEFRIIDTSNPFPGRNAINGTGRLVGENWCTPNIKNVDKIKNIDNLDTSRALKLASGVISDVQQVDLENYDIDENGIIDFLDINIIEDYKLGITRCNSDNGNVRLFIKNRPNSYGINPEKPKKKYDPKYRITLDASTIQAIIDYNKSNAYDDNDKLDCKSGKCESSFLTTFGFVNRDNAES